MPVAQPTTTKSVVWSDGRPESKSRLASGRHFGARLSQRLSVQAPVEYLRVRHTLGAVSERVEWAKVDSGPRELEIPRETWGILLGRLEAVSSTDGLVEKVSRVRAGRPVDLTGEDEALIRKVVRDWELEVGSASLPPSICQLRDVLRNFVLAYSRGGVEIQWDSRNLLLDRLRRSPTAADVVTAFEKPDASHPLRLTDEQMIVLRDVVVGWQDEVGVSRLPPGIIRLRGALDEHVRDVQMHNRRAQSPD